MSEDDKFWEKVLIVNMLRMTKEQKENLRKSLKNKVDETNE